MEALIESATGLSRVDVRRHGLCSHYGYYVIFSRSPGTKPLGTVDVSGITYSEYV